MRFASLGSGSRGNATLVQAGGTCLLVDCGYSVREFEARCAELEVDPDAIGALLVTHEHGDHLKGVGALARKYRLPVWMTHGTFRSGRCGDIPELHLFGTHTSSFRIGGIEVAPYAVPHDAREPSQFVFSHEGRHLGLLTDAGSITPHMVAALDGVDALLLECNHDRRMLQEGPYPPSLRSRVGGSFGHLSNAQAGELLASIDCGRLQHLVLGHLSEKNNHPELARAAVLEGREGLEPVLSVLRQDLCSDWFAV